MKKITNLIDKIPPFNFYSLLLKLVGLGFIIICIISLIKDGPSQFIQGLGLSFGLLFIAFGEVINLLQKLLDKKRR